MLERYSSPKDIASLLSLLSDGTGQILNGGTDLLVQIEIGRKKPMHLIDISNIEVLSRFEIFADRVEIGATVRVSELCNSPYIWDHYHALALGMQDLGSHQIRERATLTGNIVNASPASDTLPGLYVSGALAEITSSEGVSTVAVEKLATAPGRTVLIPSMFVSKIILPTPKLGFRSGFEKVKRLNGHDIAMVSAAVSVSHTSLRCAIGSCGPKVVCFELDIDDFQGLDVLVAKMHDLISPISDIRASADYRRAMAEYAVTRAYEQCLDTHAEEGR